MEVSKAKIASHTQEPASLSREVIMILTKLPSLIVTLATDSTHVPLRPGEDFVLMFI